MHAFIRKLLTEKYDSGTANETSILYGGSVNAANAKELFNQTDIDGGLVGGASLKADEFVAIIAALP
jgi:triosephosphate isomerase